MLLPGIHWQWLQYCSVWALFLWILFYILKQTVLEVKALQSVKKSDYPLALRRGNIAGTLSL